MSVARLLLIDDNISLLRILCRFLKQHSDLTVVDTAQSSSEALAKAHRVKPDVILLDLAIKDVSGLDMLPRLRADLPGAHIVVLTLQDAAAYRQAALGLGADAFVSKAALSTELLPAICYAVIHVPGPGARQSQRDNGSAEAD